MYSKQLLALVTYIMCCGTMVTTAFSPLSCGVRRSTMTMKRGRGSVKKEMGGGGKGMASTPSSAPAAGGVPGNWVAIPATTKDLAGFEDRKVKVLDTNTKLLEDTLTNPTGAVSVLKVGDETYSFSHACPTCKFPLSSASVLEPTSEHPAPRVACSFCKSTYNVKTGEKTEESVGGGLFSGVAKAVFSAGDGAKDPLKLFRLGEKGGQILISLDVP